MAIALIKTAFTSGELSPSMFGHVDLARFATGASTMRNMWVSYRGGSYSRAGTAFVGFSKQTGRAYPPRMITFQFKINQGLALEFGHHYMRVVFGGAFVVDGVLPITGISQTNPAVVTTTGALAAVSATPITAGVISSYAPGDKVTLAGGTFTTATVLRVTNTVLLALQNNLPGSGYVPADTVTLAGGTATTAAVVTVATTQVSAVVSIVNAGTGGTPGTATVVGTTGTGTKFAVQVTISAGGIITAIGALTIPGAYTVNPTTLTAEPVTGGGLTGAQLSITMGVGTLSVTTAGLYTANPANLEFTQASTSGAGTGATFQFALMAPNAVTVFTPGVYTAFPVNPVAQASTTGIGLGVTFTMATATVAGYADGDWVAIAGVDGMTEVNGGTYVVHGATTTSFQIYDVYGAPVDATLFHAYTAGGTASRIYTLATPYAEQDLPWLKFTESADVMSICCVNQDTQVEYAGQDLRRNSDTDWVFEPVVAQPTVVPPTGLSCVSTSPNSGSDTGSKSTYAYVVTSINSDDGTESIASSIGKISNAVNISAESGTITLSWKGVAGVNEYNVYKATPGFQSAPIPDGAPFGFAGFAYGTQFNDTNIVSDFSQTPPRHQNPFARGQIIAVTPISGGTGYTHAVATVNSLTGSGAVLQVVLQQQSSVIILGTSVSAVLVLDAGEGYQPGDTVTITGNGTGATASLKVGPETGTYPSVPAYFQQRRAYANSLNNPDTYWLSQPGSYTNFDTRIPTIASDAITGTPWSVQVNGIQFMLSMPGGLVALTGLSAWQLTGAGGSSLNPQPLTPSTQQAQPQAYNGCSATVPPIKIDYDIIFVQAKGSIYRSFSYNFYTNIYTGVDMTLNSSQLFTGYTIREHAWCEEPYKILWAVRDDGTMLSLTLVKPQEVAGWARHDTNGQFVSVCAVTEPPVDALYLATQRYPGTNTAYMIERMDDRIWSSAEDCWCVDCGLTLGQPEPAAALSASSATGLGAIAAGIIASGGSGYSAAASAVVVDDNGAGPGTGAVPVLTIVAGVITAVSFGPGQQGTGYTYPRLDITDPANAGSGASAILALDNSATFAASAAVFSIDNVGSVIRMGGGIATITAYVDTLHVVANITAPIVAIRPNSGGLVQQQAAGSWTMTKPATTIGGLEHLIGAVVTGVADGQVIAPRTVSALGSITLDAPASAVTVGLGFQTQLQSVYLDAGDPTVQGQRKKIAAVTARVEASGPFSIGANQVDGSTLTPPQIAPTWTGMTAAPDGGTAPYASSVTPLYTGDTRIPVGGGYEKPGQVALQQDLPLPLQVLALVPEILPGDEPEAKAPPRQRQAAQ